MILIFQLKSRHLIKIFDFNLKKCNIYGKIFKVCKIEKNNMTRPIVSVANHMFILRQHRLQDKHQLITHIGMSLQQVSKH